MRRLPVVLLAGLGASTVMAQQPFHGSIEVRRVLTAVRVVDTSGQPLSDLGVEDFSVTLNGEPVPVEAAEWIATGGAARRISSAGVGEEEGLQRPSVGAPAPAGRLIVLVFQTDFHPVRLTGLYRMSYYATEFVRTLGEGDRIALVVYGSHLQLHVDFTDDVDGLCELLTVPSLVRNLRPQATASEPSLAENLDDAAARDAATFSQGLRVLGEALEGLPGRKEVVLFAWGIGRYTGDSVWLGTDYNEAKLALARARATVYSLDVTNADYHDLEVGLSRISHDTGGFYMKTHLFPTQAMERLEAALSGYYELTLVPSEDVGEYFTVDVEVDRRGCTVMAAPVQAVAP